jgi:hypothetical protein
MDGRETPDTINLGREHHVKNVGVIVGLLQEILIIVRVTQRLERGLNI